MGTAGIVAGVMLGMMAGGAGAADAPAAPKTADSAMEAITGGKLIFNLRLRYEYSTRRRPEVGNAFTNRTLFGWETATLPYRSSRCASKGSRRPHRRTALHRRADGTDTLSDHRTRKTGRQPALRRLHRNSRHEDPCRTHGAEARQRAFHRKRRIPPGDAGVQWRADREPSPPNVEL